MRYQTADSRGVYPPKANDANSLRLNFTPPLSISLSFFSFPFRSLSFLALSIPFSIYSLPRIQLADTGKRYKLPSRARLFNAFWRIYGSQNAPRGSIFQLPEHFLWRKMRHSS